MNTSNADTLGKSIALSGSKQGATACSACHGLKGEGNPAAAYPYLAGLPAEYIKHQLISFRNGTRENPIMKPIASNLSDRDMNAVAKYFSSLKNPLLNRKLNVTTKMEMTGQQLVMNGKWQQGMPACYQCHGERGQGIPPHFPAIRGQSYDYLYHQLKAWKSGERQNDHLALMQAIVTKLSDSELQAVSRYLSAQ